MLQGDPGINGIKGEKVGDYFCRESLFSSTYFSFGLIPGRICFIGFHWLDPVQLDGNSVSFIHVHKNKQQRKATQF